MQMETIKVQKKWPPKLGASGKMGPANIVGVDGRKWAMWPRDVDPDRLQEGQEYVCGVEPTDVYNGVQQYKIKSVIDGQTKPIPKVLQTPVYQQTKAPSEKLSIESLAILKSMLEAGWPIDQPIPAGAVTARLNEVAKGVALSILHTQAKAEDDMEGDAIPF